MKAQIQTLVVCATIALASVAVGQEPAKNAAATPVQDGKQADAHGAAAFSVPSPSCPNGIGLGSCGLGEVQANCVGTRSGYPRLRYRLRYAAYDKISPRPYYSYSKNGIEAQLTHQWNQQQMQQYPWHCNYNYWQYGRPTALVVPPNAAFQSVYSWGVGETRSVPIYHQFGRAYPGADGGAAGNGAAFSNTPYWPSNTSQFGVYPVRAPF